MHVPWAHNLTRNTTYFCLIMEAKIEALWPVLAPSIPKLVQILIQVEYL